MALDTRSGAPPDREQLRSCRRIDRAMNKTTAPSASVARIPAAPTTTKLAITASPVLVRATGLIRQVLVQPSIWTDRINLMDPAIRPIPTFDRPERIPPRNGYQGNKPEQTHDSVSKDGSSRWNHPRYRTGWYVWHHWQQPAG